jgi:quercetin dioxygenase-like cupin family protein
MTIASDEPISRRVRRVVTGHDSNGTAKVLWDGPATNTRMRGESRSTLIWCTDSTPAKIGLGEEIEDMGLRKLGTPPPKNGTRFTINDIPPGNKAVVHRTETLDYAIVVSGEIDLTLDNQVVVHLKAGDVAVQRGTNHSWENHGRGTARVAFVLIDATPLGIGHPILPGNLVGEN